MKMKKVNACWIAVFWAFAANAEISLKDQSEILGAWNLYAEAAKLDGEKKDLSVEWDFKNDGTLYTKSIDTFGRTKTFEVTLKYFVEDGAIKKQSAPGREKYDICKVVNKTDSEMTLKCTYLYYFLNKK